LRGYLDTSFIILKRDEEDEDEYAYYGHCDFDTEREIFKKITFEQGSYIVVPITSGALLQKIETTKPQKGNDVDTKKLTVKGLSDQYLEVRQYYCGTVFDIFRKIDLSINGMLSARELNEFGRIIDDKRFTELKQKDFTSEKFKGISCTKDGLTPFGFVQFLLQNFKKEEFPAMLKKLGYDEKLNSLKSRVFVITFQSDEPLRVQVNDILEANMHKKAISLFFNHLKDEDMVEVDNDKNDDIDIVKFYDSNSKCYIFGAVNNSDSR